MPRHFLLLVYSFLVVQLLSAQDNRQYAFTHYTVKDGLASYNTSSIVQDEQGFIWVGTVNGLQRFDGSRFITFRHTPGDISSLPDNHIVQLLLDKQQQLWVLLGSGKVGIFNTRRFSFKEVKLNVTNKNFLKHTRRLREYSDGSLVYIILHGDILTYNKKNNEFAASHNPFNLPANWKIASIIEDTAARKYWISGDSGIAIYNKINKQLNYKGHNVDKEPFVENFSKLNWLSNYMVDSKGRLWFLQWSIYEESPFIYCYDTRKQQMLINAYNISGLLKQYVEPDDIFQQKDGTIWLRGMGLLGKYIEDQQHFQIVSNGYVNDQGISYEIVNTLFEDREQNIWIATSNNGVYLFNPAKQLFRSIKHLSRNTGLQGNGGLLSFANTNAGGILTGSWEDGLYMYDSALNIVLITIKGVDSIDKYSAWSMCRLKDNHTMWIAGQPAFVMVYDQATNTARKYEPPIFKRVTIRQVVEDRKNNMWLGTHGYGLFKWMASQAIPTFNDGFYKIPGIPNQLVEKLLIDSKGFLWAALRNEGIFKIDPSTDSIIEHITAEGPLLKRLFNNDGAAILEYNDTTMLFVTGALNIYNTKSNRITHITSSDGLPSDMIVSMEKDNNGYIWLGMLNGLCRMNLANKTFTYYDRNDGIANDNFNIAASYRLPDGRMLFGTANDFLVFNPKDSKADISPPNVIITDFSINNKSLSVDSLQSLSRIELPSDENSFNISFSSLFYYKSNNLLYHYMLEGIDKEWRKTTDIHQAIYNYVPPGKYTFKVRAESADGLPSINVTELKIKINPPFWQAWWFYCVLALLAGSLVYWLDTERMKRKQMMEKMRSDIADNLHEDINTALNNINILSEIAKLKANKEPGKSIEYLEQIHQKSHNMIIAMDDMLWSIDPDNDSMLKTIDRMKEFIDAMRNRHSTQIDMLVDKKVEKLELNMKVRHEAFLLFKDSVRPIVQGGAQNCRIYINLEKINLSYTIQFDNADADIPQLNDLLQKDQMKAKLESINAIMNIQLYKNYSVVTIRIPVIEKA